MVSSRVNKRAENNRAMLHANAIALPTTRQTRRRQRALARHTAESAAIRANSGRRAQRAFRAAYHRDLQILCGGIVPDEEDALRILGKTIDQLPNGIYGYTQADLVAIKPYLLLITQVEGQSQFYVVTEDDIKDFVSRLGADGWSAARCPSPITSLAKTPVNTKILYGVCKYDLPASEATKAQWIKQEKQTLGRGEAWVAPVWHQPKTERRQGAPVFLHMNCRLTMASFDLKDGKGAAVAERDITPDRDDEDVFVRVIIARDSQEHNNTITNNYRILIRAAQYTIWATRHPNQVDPQLAATAPPAVTSFSSLGMHQPHYQFDILTSLNARLTAGLGDLGSGAVARDGVMPQGANCFTAECRESLSKFVSKY